MIVKLYTETLDEEPVWVDFDIDKHAPTGYWNVPAYIDEDGLSVASDEWNIVMPSMVMTVRDCEGLLFFLKYKFEK